MKTLSQVIHQPGRVFEYSHGRCHCTVPGKKCATSVETATGAKLARIRNKFETRDKIIVKVVGDDTYRVLAIYGVA